MNNDNKDICQETNNKPIIDLLALWEEVKDMIQEKRAIEGENKIFLNFLLSIKKTGFFQKNMI